jgi:hypothetical protein
MSFTMYALKKSNPASVKKPLAKEEKGFVLQTLDH